MTITEARQLVAQFKSNGAEIGLINLEIKKLAERGRATYRHIDFTEYHLAEVLACYFRDQGFHSYVEDRYHPRGVVVYNLVIEWA